jgi:K+-sensing histidine kinase KdpD
MNRLPQSPLHGSVVALALTAVALLISLLLRPHMEPDFFLLFEVAVWLSAWFYGFTVGMLAAGASGIALVYVFAAGGASPTLVTTRPVSFLVVATLAGFDSGKYRRRGAGDR